MDNWLRRSALDARFVDLAIFMSLLVWPWLILITFGLALYAWKFVLLCQAIALPFSILGWSVGFRTGRRFGFRPPQAAMVAGWAGLVAAEIGLLSVLALWHDWDPSAGLFAFPALAVLVTLGVKWFYRTATWGTSQLQDEGLNR